MGKLTLHVEVDEATVRDLEARGIDPLRFAEVGFSDAYERAKRWSLVESAKEKAKDPEGAIRRAREWAERNRGVLEEHAPLGRRKRVFRRGLADVVIQQFDVCTVPERAETRWRRWFFSRTCFQE